MNTIKKITLMSFTFISSYLSSQKLNYTYLQNDPENYVPKLNINLDLMQMDGSFNNIMGLSFNTAVWGVGHINEKLGVNFAARKSYLSFSKLTNPEMFGNLEFDAGVCFLPIKSSKTKKIQIVLSRSRGTNDMGQTVETTRFIMVPGTKLKFHGLHAGAMYKRTGFDLQDLMKDWDDSKLEQTNYSTTGIYAGYVMRQLTNLIVNVDGYGKRFHSVAREFYVDFTYNPMNNFQKLSKNTMDESEYNKLIKTTLNESPIGYKIGWRTFQIAPKSVTNKRFGVSGAFEAGKRPYLGWFVAGSVGLTIIKK